MAMTFEIGDIVEVHGLYTYCTGLVGRVVDVLPGSLRVTPIWILSHPRVRSLVSIPKNGTILLFAYKFSLITHLDTPSEVVENK